MFKDEYVFSQLVKFLDYEKFKYIVKKYNGNKYIKSYTCWNQLLTMMFGHYPIERASEIWLWLWKHMLGNSTISESGNL